MQTNLPESLLATSEGARADEILRRCVHCGFCNATCPTYQLIGDELDGPRGRIYLMKDMLETGHADPVTQLHLDRCLTCRSCETTCPSGVEYGELLEIGRELMERSLSRPKTEQFRRRWLVKVLPDPRRLKRWRALGRSVRWFMPKNLRSLVRKTAPTMAVSDPNAEVIVMQGCVQRSLTPEVNDHLTNLLAARGTTVRFSEGEACCGGLALHLGEADAAKADMRRNIDRLDWSGADCIVSTASGCGVTLKDYGRLLGDESAYADTAAAFASRVVDVSELLDRFQFKKLDGIERVAWHPPCTLQHGQKIQGKVEAILTRAGYQLVDVRDAHICCGSAGSYSILQPQIAAELKTQKLANLLASEPEVIATANVGCQTHLATQASVPVLHWLQLLQ